MNTPFEGRNRFFRPLGYPKEQQKHVPLGYPVIEPEPDNRSWKHPPPLTQRKDMSEAELQADREALLAQGEFFSEIRWQVHLEHEKSRGPRRTRIKEFSKKNIKKLFEQQEHQCFYCATEISLERHHKDHIIPLAQSGPNHMDNIVLTCPECNMAKGSQDPYVFMKTSSRQLRPKAKLKEDIDRQTAIALRRIPKWARQII